MKLRLSHIAYPMTSLGVGQRIGIWVAGCPMRCQHCITPELQALDAGKVIDVSILVKHLQTIALPIDGISISGGEPFLQATALLDLVLQLRQQQANWNILLFSGYTLNYITKNIKSATKILDQIDMLIDGPFVANQMTSHPLLASNNQQLHTFSKQGETLKSKMASIHPNQANLALGQDRDYLIGILNPSQRQQYHQALNVSK